MAANPWDNDPIVSAVPAAAPAGGNPWDNDPIVSAAPDTASKPLTVGSAIKGAGDVALTGALNILPAAANSVIDLGSRITGNGPAKDTILEAQLGDSGRNLMQNILKPRTANGLDVSDEELRAALDPSGTMPIERLRAAYKLEGAKSTAQILKDSGTTAGDIVGNAIDVGGDVANIVPAASLTKGVVSAGVRGAVVGGAADRAAMQARLADAAANDTQLTAGQATGSPTLQYAEGASSKLWGGGPIKAAAKAQTENLGNHLDQIVENLSQGSTPSPTAAGTAINVGADTAKANMRAAEKAAYDKVDQLVPPQSPVDVSGTLAKLDTLATPTPGAEATTGALISPKIKAMRDNLQADIAKNGSATVPYSAATDLRTQLGNSIDWGFAPSNPVENAALKQVHGALKGDIDAGASAISPDAKQAVSDARSLYSANQDRRDLLNSIIDKAGGPEAVYQAATNGTKQGATKIGGVMSALDPGQQNLVRATVINRLGKAVPGMQNAEGDVFNPSTFLTNWAKLDPTAKDALFGASGAPKTLRAGLDSLAKTMSNIREGTKLQNFSGTGEAVGHMGGLLAAWEGVKHVLTSAHPVAAGATVAGGLAANNLLARVLVNPRTVRWLAQSTKAPTSTALASAVTQLAKMGKVDPDARNLAAALQQNGDAL